LHVKGGGRKEKKKGEEYAKVKGDWSRNRRILGKKHPSREPSGGEKTEKKEFVGGSRWRGRFEGLSGLKSRRRWAGKRKRGT